jgi:3-methyladenine DNA glycosylase AlkD
VPAKISAAQFVEQLTLLLPTEKRQYFQGTLEPGEDDGEMGVPMREVFALAKEFIDMTPEEIENLLESPIHDVRVGAVSIMDWQARNKKTPAARRKELFDLYIRRHDRINGWDLVDRSAPYVVGGYLSDKPRDILYELTRSRNWWERRTAIVSTYYFIRQGDSTETFRIAEILVNDENDLVQKAVGGWVREAGKKDHQELLRFLERHAATMPRTVLRYAIEHLDAQQKAYFMNMKRNSFLQ